MKIRIVSVGKMKEKYWRDAAAEYARRLGRYCSLEQFEAADESTPQELSEKERERILEKEGERILRYIPEGSFCIALVIEGRSFSSEAFSDYLKERMDHGSSDLTFVIGGSLGLSRQVRKRADLQLSFSEFTFPHQMMRVVLLEQIYRSFRIMNHEPYHK